MHLTKMYGRNVFTLFFYVISIALSIRLSFYFNDSTRYIPLRVIIATFPFVLFSSLYVKNGLLRWRNAISLLLYSIISIAYILIWSIDIGYTAVGKSIEFIYPLAVLISLKSICEKITLKEVIKGGQLFTIASILLMLIDTYIRFMHPEYAVKGDGVGYSDALKRDTFYIFKYGSIMYLDSNYVALHALVVSVLVYYLFSGFYRNILSFICILIIVMTLSRAAYVAFSIIPTLYIFRKTRIQSKFILFSIVCPLMLIIITRYIYLSDFDDASFETKVGIFNSFFSKIFEVDLGTLMFGQGFDVGGYLYSWKEGGYAHAMIPLVVGEVGVFGMFFYISILIFAYLKVGFDSLYITLPMIVAGMSLIYPYDTMYIYAVLLLFYIKIKSRKYNEVYNG
ncbi:hypothetical protein C3Y05_007965 [Aeromonas allosaccharophila]|uniref:hypothetical protein n=1 Tax=Aeromonas allosaccharophila TaxID=656 RepID=UPI0013CD3E5A|nr:hypothetical protein [Aeromonas allosaccharophila]WDO03527.1 hypothetical protein C3Y05_007965 [Aeromonas allosaccharophila]